MNTEKFAWLDGSSRKTDSNGYTVKLVNDQVALALAEDYKPNQDKRIIGVVTDSETAELGWATVQLSGRVHVYQESAKSTAWVLLKQNSKQGLYGPMDEYFIR